MAWTNAGTLNTATLFGHLAKPARTQEGQATGILKYVYADASGDVKCGLLLDDGGPVILKPAEIEVDEVIPGKLIPTDPEGKLVIPEGLEAVSFDGKTLEPATADVKP